MVLIVVEEVKYLLTPW